MRKFHAACGLVAAMVVAMSTLVGTATATPTGSSEKRSFAWPDSYLKLTISPVAPEPTVRNWVPRSKTTLTCNPDGGTHPDPEEACASLASVGGKVYALPRVQNVFCPLIYAPVRVTAKGFWRGSMVYHSAEHGNSCEAAIETNFLFNFGH